MEESLATYATNRKQADGVLREAGWTWISPKPSRELEEEMLAAANNLEFEKAALCRDQIKELKRALDGAGPGKPVAPATKPISYRKRGGGRVSK